MTQGNTNVQNASLALDIVRLLFSESKSNDLFRFLGWLRPPSKLTRELKVDCDRYYNKYNAIQKGVTA